MAEIAETLDKSRLGFFPQDLLDPGQNTEPRQWQEIWIYDTTAAERGQVIDAVLHPDKHDVRAVLGGLLDGRPEALTPEQKLERIRQLVCE